jgi:hypothetical protein
MSDERVGGDGAAVFEEYGVAEQFRRFHANGARRLVDGVHDATGKIIRCGGGFGRPNLSAIAQHDDVGKRPASIDANDVLRFRCHAAFPPFVSDTMTKEPTTGLDRKRKAVWSSLEARRKNYRPGAVLHNEDGSIPSILLGKTLLTAQGF